MRAPIDRQVQKTSAVFSRTIAASNAKVESA